jgi:hypothetical protein
MVVALRWSIWRIHLQSTTGALRMRARPLQSMIHIISSVLVSSSQRAFEFLCFLVNSLSIFREYVDTICASVNEKLQEDGCILLSDILRTYDLPTELLTSAIRSRLGELYCCFSHAILLYYRSFDRWTNG